MDLYSALPDLALPPVPLAFAVSTRGTKMVRAAASSLLNRYPPKHTRSRGRGLSGSTGRGAASRSPLAVHWQVVS